MLLILKVNLSMLSFVFVNIAEISTDASKFMTVEHICSWAGLSPDNNESAGKKSPR